MPTNHRYSSTWDSHYTEYRTLKTKHKKETTEKKQETKIICFKKKVDKAKLIIPKIREQLDLINSFLFELIKKPQEIEKNDIILKKLIDKMPKFTRDEYYNLLVNEYKLARKYLICLSCKKDLQDLYMENQNLDERVVCPDCGLTYYNNKKKKKKTFCQESEFSSYDIISEISQETIQERAEQPALPVIRDLHLHEIANSPTLSVTSYEGENIQISTDSANFPEETPEQSQ